MARKKSLRMKAREAFMESVDRNILFAHIQASVGCSRAGAKALAFAFLYNSTEKYMESLLKREGNMPKEKA